MKFSGDFSGAGSQAENGAFPIRAPHPKTEDAPTSAFLWLRVGKRY
jgi:hypothetical protein